MKPLLAFALTVGLLGPAVSVLAAPVRDMMGREVEIARAVTRVVSLAPSLTEILFALGAGELTVGVTDFCDYPPAAVGKPKVGTVQAPNPEVILALQPDLVLATTEGNRQETVFLLERLGLPTFVVRPEGLDGIYASIRSVGRLLGRPARASALVEVMRSRVNWVVRQVAGHPRVPVLYVLWPDPLITAGRGSVIDSLIAVAGGENVARGSALRYPRLGLEEVLRVNPEVILLAGMGSRPLRPEAVQGWAGWHVLRAVRAGRVQSLDGDLLHRSGPRIVEGLEAMARALHPDAFPASSRETAQ
ncbi:MAG TPA: cobalamin-binding protein [Candidatus Methylomirabilis sp.]|jgi:iron complex transport system substrate-binding protein|nr:cobalamin-binding protein [Candidatus Methylomirabilis sp.]